MKRKAIVYRLYERWLMAQLQDRPLPQHVGVMLDGNRRWAREGGHDVRAGYERGAAKICDLLSWCDELNISVVTLYLLSKDNLSRKSDELKVLLPTIEGAMTEVAALKKWRVRPIGASDLLPATTAEHLKAIEDQTANNAPRHVNVAIGYGGRHEIADAVKSLLRYHATLGTSLEDLAEQITESDIGEHLYTKGQPDPDLVIRTSGEQRLSGFLLWQSANTELYFHEAYWPDFRRTDFLRSLREYSKRERRFGV